MTPPDTDWCSLLELICALLADRRRNSPCMAALGLLCSMAQGRRTEAIADTSPGWGSRSRYRDDAGRTRAAGHSRPLAKEYVLALESIRQDQGERHIPPLLRR